MSNRTHMQFGSVEAVCISSKKGLVKREVEEVRLQQDWGIDGDAHAGAWHRQVSLLAGESIDRVKEILPRLRNGAFAENIITRGLDLASLEIGDLLAIEGGVTLEVTQIGKECHNSGCAIKKATGECIMPTEGIFTRVQKGGVVKKNADIATYREIQEQEAGLPDAIESAG